MEEKEEMKRKISDLGKLDEEFCNFMHKVNEVGSIVKKLASKNPDIQKIGDQEAKSYLGEETILENVDENTIALKVTSNRTILNRKALLTESNANQMSKEAFMDEVSKDAENRYKDRLRRTEKMETFKKQATLAFRRGEYERALVLYNKAIEQIKDSVLLYNNRALTYIKLGLLDKARRDLKDWALRVNEDCLKSWLLLAKVHFLDGNEDEFEECVLEAKRRNPEDVELVEDYVKKIQENSSNK